MWLRWLALLCVLSCACGWKTGLAVDGPGVLVDAESADSPRSDSGFDDSGTVDAGTGCEGYPRNARVLVEDEAFAPTAIGLRGDTLFFAVRDARPLSEEQTGGIYQMPMRGGAYERLDLAEPSYGGPILVGPDYLIYHQVRPTRTGPGAWAFAYPAVVVELESAMPRVLVTELEEGAGRASPMALLGGRLVFGRFRSPPRTDLGEIGSYDVRGGMERTLAEGRDLRHAVGAGRNVWLWMYDEGEGVLARVTSAGDVRDVERFDDFSCCWPWVADTNTLFMKRGDLLEAWPVGGDSRVVVEATTRSAMSHAAVDDRFVYWADEGNIHYVEKTGGDAQTLVEDDRGFVQGLATDGCGVFWTAVNPPRLSVISAP